MNQQMIQSSRSEKNTYFFQKTQFFNTNPLQMLKIIISFIMCIVVSTLYASTINVKDFGAKGNGINDDAPAIKKAIEVAIKQKAEKLLFPKGTYAVKKFFSVHHIFAFENVENLTIEGEDGALILVKNPKIGCMSFRNSKNLTIKNLKFDYDPLPFTQGKIIKRSCKRGVFEITYKIMKGFENPDSKTFKNGPKVFVCYDEKGKLNNRSSLIRWSSMDKVKDGVYKSKVSLYQGNPAFLKKGHIVVLPGRLFGKSVFSFAFIDNLFLEDLHVMTSPEVFALATECNGIVLRNCKIAPPEGSNRLISTCADGFFVLGGRKGPTVENCHFNGNQDDSMNIHATAGNVYGMLAKDSIVVSETPWCSRNKKRLWKKGDAIELLSKKLEVVLSGKIADLKPTKVGGDYTWEIKLAPGFKSTLDLAKYPKREQKYDDLMAFNGNLCGNNFSIKNTVFENHRSKGIVLQSRGGIVEGCTLKNMDGGIFVLGELHYKDGPHSRNITIQNNKFIDLGTHVNKAPVTIANLTVAKTLDFSDIKVLKNEFIRCKLPAVYVNNAKNIVIEGNKVEGFVENQFVKGNKTENVIIKNNTVKVIEKKK